MASSGGTHAFEADRAAIGIQHTARPALADLMNRTKVSHSFPHCPGRHHLFEAMSFSMALRGIASARSRFSFAFSSSRAFIRGFYPATLRFPFVECHVADAVFAADINGFGSGHLLLQNRNNLLF
jgi:hypothetical protein